jgi:hypothetical protein
VLEEGGSGSPMEPRMEETCLRLMNSMARLRIACRTMTGMGIGLQCGEMKLSDLVITSFQENLLRL